MFRDVQDRESVDFTLDKANRSFKFNSTSSATCITSVSVFTTNSGRSLSRDPSYQYQVTLNSSAKKGTSLVGPKPKTVQWKMSCTNPSTNGDSSGCFQNRLENIMPGSYYTRSIVQTGKVSLHKCVASGSKISPIEFHQNEGRAIHFQIDNIQQH